MTDNIFLGVPDKRASQLIAEIKATMKQMIDNDPEDGVTRGQLWEAIFKESTAGTFAEHFILGLNAQRLLEEHFAHEALHALGHLAHHIGQPLKGRKVD